MGGEAIRMWEGRGRGGACETKRKQELESQEEGEKMRSGVWEERENAEGSQRRGADNQAGRGAEGGAEGEEEEGREG